MNKLLFNILCMLPLLGFAQTSETFDGTWTTPTGNSGAGGPTGWAIANVTGPQKKWVQGSGGSYAGGHHAYLEAENVQNGTVSEDWLISPAVQVPANGQVSFFSKLAQAGSQGSTYKIMVKTSNGGTVADQTTLTNYVQLVQWTELQINPDQTIWTQKAVSLANYVGQLVYIAFVMTGDNGDSWMIDNMHVNASCPTPTNITATNLTATTATLGWMTPPDVTSWDVEVLPTWGETTGTGIVVTSNPYVVTGLTPGVEYKVFIHSVCGPDNRSDYAGPIFFITPNCEASNQCPYIFRITSTDGWGWGLGSMKVFQNNNIAATLTLTSFNGYQQDIPVPLCDGMPFSLDWTSGDSYPQNVGVEVINVYGEVIYSKPPGTGTPGTTLYTGMGNCGAVDCFAPYNVAATGLGTTANVTFSGPASAVYEYYITANESVTPLPETVPRGTASANLFDIDDLNPETAYFIYVRTVCSDENMSYWAGPATITMGTGNLITGAIRLDSNEDGDCSDTEDFAIPGTQLVVTVGTDEPIYAFANAEGDYVIDDLPDGDDVAVSIQPVAPYGFDEIDPVSLTVDFPAVTPTVADVCFALSDINNDIEVVLVPTTNAQAGFLSSYTAVVYNNAPIAATGVTLSIDYDNGHIDFMSANQTFTEVDSNTVLISLGNVAPFGSATALIEFQVLPPPVNIGSEALTFTCYASMAETDTAIENNYYTLNQVVVNSLDPNDITVHEGAAVFIGNEDRYLHYTIRFQNTGSAPAVNIRVENQLDAKLDWATFDPITASHDFTTVRDANGLVNFRFNNIFLADSTSNEPESHGFVTYRIKPKAEIVEVGDVISSTAGIFFDFNAPVITNTVTTVFTEVASVKANETGKVKLYPNPVKDALYINALQSTLQSVDIYDINGRLCITSGSVATIDTHMLSAGMYLVKANTDKGTSTYKLIKH